MTERSESERAELVALADDAADDLLQEVRDLIDEGLDECLPSSDIIGNVSRSINSALRSSQSTSDAGGGVRVKPLRWTRSKVFGFYKWRGIGAFGEFSAFSEGDMTPELIESAKGRIQADYEHSVLSALSKPAPVDANASAEARLRDALNAATVSCSGLEITIQCNDHDVKDAIFDGLEALSPDPHASDCEKQGETGKTEFITGYFTDQYKAGAKPPVGPSDRTADVTVEDILQPFDDIYVRDGFCDWADVATAMDEVRALLDAFTVGRR